MKKNYSARSAVIIKHSNSIRRQYLKNPDEKFKNPEF